MDILITDLRELIANLGRNGGQMSPSVYDTAQALRFAPPDEGPEPAIEWLLSQQQVDGGWGGLAAPLSRHMPTLAAVLALKKYGQTPVAQDALQEGIDFLYQTAYQWQPPLPEEMPTGVELILPQLLCEADALELGLPSEPYRALIELGAHKRQLIQKHNPKAGTTPVFSWEAWGDKPETAVIDGTGGIGHNPSATAFWLQKADSLPHLSAERIAAKRYLDQASAATFIDIPGLVPTAWPVDRFEQIYVLHTLQLAGFLDFAPLADLIERELDDVLRALTPQGIGFSDHFVPDGDDTYAALAVLKGSNRPIDRKYLDIFRTETHFNTYPGELQPSPTVTARAIHAMSLWGERYKPAEEFIRQRQKEDGRWGGDKWNTSWLYATFLAVFALKATGGPEHQPAIQKAIHALLQQQNPDGGWSTTGISNLTETGMGILTLQLCESSRTPQAIERAFGWMLENYRPFAFNETMCWQNKQEYRIHRVDRTFELAAMLSVTLAMRETEAA
ncbi:MAG: hypothetical protein KC441_15815 [Anaerolineales bacterium]|nr:hypothetical protein [Anaerolineales bacterium]